MDNIEIIGKMNCYKDKWNYINKVDYPAFTALILKNPKNDNEYMEDEISYYIVSSPFYGRIDKKTFSSLEKLKEYYENIKEEGWIIDWKWEKDRYFYEHIKKNNIC